ncbi:MAG: ABC transporter substrate-binding protein, partial [Rhodospirillaceae bacterium]|nr:ABC transporter substrate-binding protein [Rhodospirillaceae bacterium]
YYAAQELGYYREAGLDVHLREAETDTNIVEEVASGRAQYGIGTSSLLLEQAAGYPVVVLAAIFQHSALALVTRRDPQHQSLRDLKGKRIMIEPLSDELFAYLRKEGLNREAFTLVEHSQAVQNLVAGTVDAASAYTTSELFFLDRAGVPYRVYSPRSAGIDFYGDTLFTSSQELKTHPDRVAAFRHASLRGWTYAMANPDAVIEIILTRYAPNIDRDFLKFEAHAMIDLINADTVEIGTMTPARWQTIADTYADLDLLRHRPLRDNFLYQPRP